MTSSSPRPTFTSLYPRLILIPLSPLDVMCSSRLSNKPLFVVTSRALSSLHSFSSPRPLGSFSPPLVWPQNDFAADAQLYQTSLAQVRVIVDLGPQVCLYDTLLLGLLCDIRCLHRQWVLFRAYALVVYWSWMVGRSGNYPFWHMVLPPLSKGRGS